MARWLAALILAWPLLEIVALVQLAEAIGLALTLALVAGAFLAGFALLRRTGLQAITRLRLALERGEEPGHTLIDAACFALAAILFIVPGPISDAAALVLMLPVTRSFLLRRIARRFEAGGPARHSVIKGEYIVVEDAPRPAGEAPTIAKPGEEGRP
jgi:UPF0716 protein FxsA